MDESHACFYFLEETEETRAAGIPAWELEYIIFPFFFFGPDSRNLGIEKTMKAERLDMGCSSHMIVFRLSEWSWSINTPLVLPQS